MMQCHSPAVLRALVFGLPQLALCRAAMYDWSGTHSGHSRRGFLVGTARGHSLVSGNERE
eukprot:1913209-Prymnesium_polylepis.1